MDDYHNIIKKIFENKEKKKNLINGNDDLYNKKKNNIKYNSSLTLENDNYIMTSNGNEKINTTKSNLYSNYNNCKNTKLKKRKEEKLKKMNSNYLESNKYIDFRNYFFNKIKNNFVNGNSNNLNSNKVKKNITNPSSSNSQRKDKYEDYLFEKFEKYNKENLIYKAIKNYSHFKSLSKKFLDRMKFYSTKNKTKEEIIKQLVENSTPKIKESERINIFNHLIEDANKRAENKNKLIYDNKINKNSNDNLIKYNHKKFLSYYNNNIDKLKKKEIDLELLRKEKKENEIKKENKILKEMEKRIIKVPKKKIKEISNRMYKEAIAYNLRKEMRKSHSEKYKEEFYLNNKHYLKNSYSLNQRNNYNKLNNKSQSNINFFFDNNVKRKKNNTDVNDNLIRNLNENYYNNNVNNDKRKFITIQHAEKMVDDFFFKNK